MTRLALGGRLGKPVRPRYFSAAATSRRKSESNASAPIPTPERLRNVRRESGRNGVTVHPYGCFQRDSARRGKLPSRQPVQSRRHLWAPKPVLFVRVRWLHFCPARIAIA